MAGTATALFDTLNEFATELEGEKTAAAKSAESHTEAGGYDGPTTHPTKNVEDHAETATEGSRSAENTSDIKSDREDPRVDQVSEGTDGVNQDDQQLNIGTNQSATGEDPSTENDYKDSKEEPGGHHGTSTSHPAKAGVEDGAKYGGWGFQKLASHCSGLGNEILAAIATGHEVKQASTAVSDNNGTQPAAKPAAASDTPDGEKQAGSQTSGKPATEEGAAAANTEQTDAEKAASAGYDFATMLGMPGASDEQRAEQFIGQTIKEAQDQATLVGNYLQEFQKAAMDPSGGGEEGEDHDSEGDAASGANESGSTDGGGGEGDSGGGDPAGDGGGDILGAMGGAGGDPAAGGDPLAAALGGGGEPPADPMAGGDPMGGDPMAGGDPMGGVGGDDALAQLAAALLELGIDPAELVAAGGKMASDQSTKEKGEKLTKVANAVQTFKRSGKFNFTETKSAAERQLRDQMKAYVREATSLV